MGRMLPAVPAVGLVGGPRHTGTTAKGPVQVREGATGAGAGSGQQFPLITQPARSSVRHDMTTNTDSMSKATRITRAKG